MRINAEVYKGIEFVRLSALPKEDKKMILNSTYFKDIIKIVHGNELLTDCLPYPVYLEWHQKRYPSKMEVNSLQSPDLKNLKLAFK